METIEGIVVIIALAILFVCVAILPFMPLITERRDKCRLQMFYDSIKIGDGFKDPFYSNDPFSTNHRVLEVIDKKDNYILYEINWYDSKTNLKCKNYTTRRESMSADRFFNLVEDYEKVMIFD